MAVVRARVFEYRVDTGPDWTARSDRGGSELRRDDGWTPEHLVLAALARCTLTSLEYHAQRAGLLATAAVTTKGVVTRRETDGKFAFVDISAQLALEVEPRPERDALRELVAKAERDCFVGASLTAAPAYTWTIDGEEL
jgi:organic hydroperoxide reductase OsmC/OhrA